MKFSDKVEIGITQIEDKCYFSHGILLYSSKELAIMDYTLGMWGRNRLGYKELTKEEISKYQATPLRVPVISNVTTVVRFIDEPSFLEYEEGSSIIEERYRIHFLITKADENPLPVLIKE